MTEVLNAYGFHLHIHDVLQVEAGLQPEITPAGGLQEDVGIANTLRQFGMNTTWANIGSFRRWSARPMGESQ